MMAQQPAQTETVVVVNRIRNSMWEPEKVISVEIEAAYHKIAPPYRVAIKNTLLFQFSRRRLSDIPNGAAADAAVAGDNGQLFTVEALGYYDLISNKAKHLSQNLDHIVCLKCQCCKHVPHISGSMSCILVKGEVDGVMEAMVSTLASRLNHMKVCPKSKAYLSAEDFATLSNVVPPVKTDLAVRNFMREWFGDLKDGFFAKPSAHVPTARQVAPVTRAPAPAVSPASPPLVAALTKPVASQIGQYAAGAATAPAAVNTTQGGVISQRLNVQASLLQQQQQQRQHAAQIQQQRLQQHLLLQQQQQQQQQQQRQRQHQAYQAQQQQQKLMSQQYTTQLAQHLFRQEQQLQQQRNQTAAAAAARQPYTANTVSRQRYVPPASVDIANQFFAKASQTMEDSLFCVVEPLESEDDDEVVVMEDDDTTTTRPFKNLQCEVWVPLTSEDYAKCLDCVPFLEDWQYEKKWPITSAFAPERTRTDNVSPRRRSLMKKSNALRQVVIEAGINDVVVTLPPRIGGVYESLQDAYRLPGNRRFKRRILDLRDAYSTMTNDQKEMTLTDIVRRTLGIRKGRFVRVISGNGAVEPLSTADSHFYVRYRLERGYGDLHVPPQPLLQTPPPPRLPNAVGPRDAHQRWVRSRVSKVEYAPKKGLLRDYITWPNASSPSPVTKNVRLVDLKAKLQESTPGVSGSTVKTLNGEMNGTASDDLEDFTAAKPLTTKLNDTSLTATAASSNQLETGRARDTEAFGGGNNRIRPVCTTNKRAFGIDAQTTSVDVVEYAPSKRQRMEDVRPGEDFMVQ